MPHRLSLLRRVGELRRTYTGEYDSTLWPTMATAMSALTTADRATINDTLEAGFETRLLGETPDLAVTEQIRRSVLPDTTDPTQQQLEAALLFALGQIAPYSPPTSGNKADVPIMRPGVDDGQTVMHLPASMAAPMIATLLPRVVGESVLGLAGLRTRICRRHVRLSLIDSAPPVAVALSNTSFRQWSAIMAFARELTGHEWPMIFDTPLTVPERAAIAAGRIPGLMSLGSALFRRLRVLGTTSWLAVGLDGPRGIHMEWAGGRTAAQVAAALVHPLAGLPGTRFTATRRVNRITISISRTRGEPAATVTLRQAPVDASPPFRLVDATRAWAGFHHALALPHPGAPRPVAFVR